MGRSKKTDGKVLALPRARVTMVSPRTGWLAGWVEGSGPLVDYLENDHGPLQARTAIALDAASVERAIQSGREVLLAFDGGDAARPIVLGWIVGSTGTRVEPRSSQLTETTIDGRRVVVEASDEIVLRCGRASITLRRNGRVVISGAYIESTSEGTNRIKGGTVQIN